MNSMILSKSNYMHFLKHPAWLWLEKYKKHLLPPVDEDTQAMFDAGHLFESYAEQLFSGGVTLGYTGGGVFDWNLYRTLPQRTQKEIDAKTRIMFQGRVEVDGLTCIFDVLERNENGSYNLYEIKSSTSAKKEHEYDLAFQTHVLEKSGIRIDGIYIIHVNNQYIRKGDIDGEELAMITDVTEAVRSHTEYTLEKIQEAKGILREKEMPDLSPSKARLGCFSEWLKIYRLLVPDILEYSIYDITRVGAKRVGELEEKGIVCIRDILEEGGFSEKQQHQIRAVKSGEQYIDREKIQTFLDNLVYPLYFLDYETFSHVITPYDGIRPYQQVPFQYSLHILRSPDAKLEHREYLHRENTLPVEMLVKKLKKDIGTTGSLLVWNESFEKNCNEMMGEIALAYKEDLLEINSRIVDLMTPFSKNWFVDKDFRGSHSIKNILPILVPELSYKELAIQGGGTAQRLWMQCIFDNKIETSEEKIMNDLRKYCALDTLAMVKIWEKLRSVVAESETKVYTKE